MHRSEDEAPDQNPVIRSLALGSVILVSEDDTRVALPTAFYPKPEITPDEFEEFLLRRVSWVRLVRR